MRSLRSAAPARPGKSAPKRSKLIRTVATWHTNRKLEITGATRLPNGPVGVLPEVGQVITAKMPSRGILRYGAHTRALRGKTGEYQCRLSHRTFRVLVQPRMDRRGRILGVRGIMKVLGDDGAEVPRKGLSESSSPGLQDLGRMARHRQRNSVTSAIRSLELAKAVADTARVNAEIRQERADAVEEKALQAQLKAEAEEKRSRFLADASAVLDSSFDRGDAMVRLIRLATLRISDWATVHFLDSRRIRRAVALHRDDALQPLLDAAFPEGDESGFLESGLLESEFRPSEGNARWELFPTLTPHDIHGVTSKASCRRALKELSVQSLIRTPIRAHGRIIGILMFGSGDPGRLFDLQDLNMARDLASRIGLARESSILYEEAQREIAMRKEIESRMRTLNAELERRVSERTQLLEEATREANSFAYTVAHDLRAPLRAITGFCQALKEDYTSAVDPTGRDYLDRIVAGARKMDELIRDLLDYARINRAEIKRSFVDLDPVIDEVVHLMAAELKERQAEVRVEKPLGRVFGHGPVLVQVLTNLISNATKFVAPSVRPMVQIRGEVRKNVVRVLIQDNGIGIAPEHQERIFGIFERLNRAEEFPGTGIGLAIVRRAMERLGGKVGVQSELSVGSTFWLELPAA
jgi:signal transduction histidine kinase